MINCHNISSLVFLNRFNICCVSVNGEFSYHGGLCVRNKDLLKNSQLYLHTSPTRIVNKCKSVKI